MSDEIKGHDEAFPNKESRSIQHCYKYFPPTGYYTYFRKENLHPSGTDFSKIKFKEP